MSTKKAVFWSIFWVVLAMLFNAVIYVWMGKEKALEFLGGFILEKSLSVDNLFLFLIIFAAFGIKSEYQRRVLNYGIAGAIVLRLIFVLLGVSVINLFHWVLYLFGAILIVSGIRMLMKEEDNTDFKNSRIIRMLNKIIPVTDTLEGNQFFVRKNKVLYATPLFAVLMLVEFTDVIFAIDSIPAIFAITTDPFIVYTSNIFAIMGLRSMYFVLGNLQEKFHYLKAGVAFILVYTGVKLLALYFEVKFPIELSLGIIFAIITVSIVASLIRARRLAQQGVPALEPSAPVEPATGAEPAAKE